MPVATTERRGVSNGDFERRLAEIEQRLGKLEAMQKTDRATLNRAEDLFREMIQAAWEKGTPEGPAAAPNPRNAD
jgi:hypothetical protein